MLMSCASSTTAKSKTTFLFFKIAAANELNNSACVISLRAFNPARTRSKIDHNTKRCASESRVFLPRRTTSRYASQLSNCHASTTCSHSVSRKCRLNLWPTTAFEASCTRSRSTSLLAIAAARRVFLKPEADDVHRVNIDPLCKTRLIAQQAL